MMSSDMNFNGRGVIANSNVSEHTMSQKKNGEDLEHKQTHGNNINESKQMNNSDRQTIAQSEIAVASVQDMIQPMSESKNTEQHDEGNADEQQQSLRMHVSESEPSLTLKVLSLNMHKDMSVEQQKQLARGGYHIALLQEYCEKEGTPFVNIKEYEEHHTWALKRMRTREQCGTVVLLKTISKLAHTKGYSFLSPDLEAVIRTPKSMTAVYMEFTSPVNVSYPRKCLLVVSIHGHNGWPWREAKPLERQLEQLTQILVEYECPAIIAGDFNTFNELRQEAVFGFMRRQGFTNFNSAVFDATRTLDYVFARGVTIEHFKTLRGLSDHPGMEFSITL